MGDNTDLVKKIDNVERKTSYLEENVIKVKSDLESLNRKFDRISFYLENDPRTNRKGIVEKIDELNEKLEKQDQDRKIFKAQATVAGGLGALLLTGITKLFPFVVSFMQNK